MKSLSIRAKLMLLLGFLLGAMLLNSLGSEVAVRRLIGLNTRLQQQGLALVERTDELHRTLYKTRGDLYKLLAMRDEIEMVGADLDKDVSNVDSAIKALEAIRTTVSDSAALAIDLVAKASSAYEEAIREVLAKARGGDFEFGTTSMKTGTAHLARMGMDAAIRTLIDLENRDVRRIEEAARTVSATATREMVIVSILLLAIGLGGGYYIVRSIIHPIHRLSDTIDRLGDGDFRRSESRTDAAAAEIARMAGSIERLRNSLREAFGSVSKTAMSAMESSESQRDMTMTLTSEAEANEREAQSSAATAQEASATIKGVSESASSSMARLESISAAIEEMTASIAGAVEEQSATTREIARSVGSAVHENREIQRSMDAGAIAVDMIAKDISGVLERGRALRGIALTAKEMSERTAEHAAQLSEDVAKFKL